MTRDNHGIKSEMQKVPNPYTGGFNRETYFTKIHFNIESTTLSIRPKIDTGATYTVIGLGHKKIKEYAERIKRSSMHGIAYDASGTELKLYGYIVTNFRLTQDIIFDRIKLFFTEDIADRALLGMDILSLFDFQYLREKKTELWDILDS